MGMIQRVLLQPMISISAATTQENRFAIPTSGFKSALAWVNVPKMSSSVACAVDIQFAPRCN